MRKFWQKNRKTSLAFLVAALLIAILWFFFWPLNRVVEAPGEAVNIQPMVKIQGKQPLKQNEFMITAVSIAPARPVSYVHRLFDPHIDIQKTNDVTGGQNNADFNNVQKVYMQSAINNAITVGFQHANRPVTKQYHGVYILNVFPQSDFKNRLRPADLIESINGQQLTKSTEYVNYIKSLPKNAPLKIMFKRDGRQMMVSGHKHDIVKGFNGIGITMIDDMTIKTDPKAHIDPGQIGGPSGGLMFALQVYSQLTQQRYQLKKIAGTGTITSDGQVGEIGGVDKKIIAAHKSGAQVFFCPYVKPTKTNLALEPGHQTNYQVAKATAKKYAPGMKVVPVTSFDQALNYLKTHQ
ncbi:PDZ domain-containing protein [Fructilactobacillus myrtifloralis]|uniref:PDZ domain-containing protein n=1 Tax=Fructilactobacillus myrtifloralis TaxID=2940301 RepID=A0ABY5BR13_9LACO|nr:SepM family pheromone-processing serine protease [Fructilactobacillus myrtifloralis]USS85493.1 PDZ domain-containing protein [Fructilactobacillus myrtifloralis]